MSTALAKVSSEVISQAVTPPVSQADAEGSLKAADLPIPLNLKKWKARQVVGQFLGHDLHGSIMTDSIITRESLEVVRTRALKHLKSKDPKVFEMAARTLINLAKAHGGLAEMEMKLAEIIHLRGQSMEFRNNAPKGPEAPRTEITAEQVYVQIGPTASGVEGINRAS